MILVVVASAYSRFSGVPDVKAALSGAAAGAAGLVVGTSLKILQGLEPDAVTIATAAAVCLAAFWLRLPMILILAIAIPASLAHRGQTSAARAVSLLASSSLTFGILLPPVDRRRQRDDPGDPSAGRGSAPLDGAIATFATLVAIGQTAPGPNVLIVSMIGWHMARGRRSARRDARHRRCRPVLLALAWGA